MGLARRSEIESQNFNQQLRDYAVNHDKILMDLADMNPTGQTEHLVLITTVRGSKRSVKIIRMR